MLLIDRRGARVPVSIVKWIAGDRRTQEFRLLSRWFQQLLRLRERFGECVFAGYDPLALNETASVGLFAAAASRSGLLALTDYASFKRTWTREARYRRGRCDLWVADPRRDLSWAFEFKQGWFSSRTRLATIETLLDRACCDARSVDMLEAHRRYGALIVTVDEREGDCAEQEERLAQLADRASYCCRLSGSAAPVWIFLERV
jgi:hypothetical protein